MSVVPSNSSTIFGVHIAAHAATSDNKTFDLFALFPIKYTAICIESVKCKKCIDACGSFVTDKLNEQKTDTFLSSSNEYRYEAVIEHSCGLAQQLKVAGVISPTVTYQCQWNGSWVTDATEAPECVCEFNVVIT